MTREELDERTERLMWWRWLFYAFVCFAFVGCTVAGLSCVHKHKNSWYAVLEFSLATLDLLTLGRTLVIFHRLKKARRQRHEWWNEYVREEARRDDADEQ